MDKFERGDEPTCLAVAREEFGEAVGTDANTVWDTFRKRKAYEEVRASLLAISQHTCTFCAGGFAQSTQTIEHFSPKSGSHAKPEKVLHWRNLFPACNACQRYKGSKHSDNLLKPDHEQYAPEKFFILNVDDGSLIPLPHAPPEYQAMARETIATYGLHRAALKNERRKALQQLHRKESLEDYRFIERLFA